MMTHYVSKHVGAIKWTKCFSDLIICIQVHKLVYESNYIAICFDRTFGHLQASISHRKLKKNSVWYTGLKMTKILVETCSNILVVNRNKQIVTFVVIIYSFVVSQTQHVCRKNMKYLLCQLPILRVESTSALFQSWPCVNILTEKFQVGVV
jgi:hypothetical protein